MNMAIAFFTGCITFALMFIIKIPIKSFTYRIASRATLDDKKCQVLYKRYNILIIIVTMTVATICYYLLLQVLGEEHFKLCCSLKAGAISVALYAVFEQWFGDDFDLWGR